MFREFLDLAVMYRVVVHSSANTSPYNKTWAPSVPLSFEHTHIGMPSPKMESSPHNSAKTFATGRRQKPKAFVLFLSIHEVIAFAASQVETPNDLTDLVNFVNTSSVPEGDVLSDSVYQYSRETGEISMVQGS